MNEPQNETEHNHNPLYEAMKALIDGGRLTGVTPELKLDGQPFLAAGDENYDPTPVTNWNDDGTSAELSEYGGQQIRGVEELRSQLLQSGDQRRQRIAHALPQYFVRLENADQFTPKQNYIAKENHNNIFMTRGMGGLQIPVISSMFEYSPRYFKKGTDEPEYDYAADRSNLDYRRVRPLDLIPNHRLAVEHNGLGWTPERITEWAKKWTGQFLESGEEPNDVLGGDPD